MYDVKMQVYCMRLQSCVVSCQLALLRTQKWVGKDFILNQAMSCLARLGGFPHLSAF